MPDAWVIARVSSYRFVLVTQSATGTSRENSLLRVQPGNRATVCPYARHLRSPRPSQIQVRAHLQPTY